MEINVDDTVYIKFDANRISDEEYWERLDNLPKVKYYPETGILHKKAEPVMLSRGTVLEVDEENDTVLVEFGRVVERVLKCDLQTLH